MKTIVLLFLMLPAFSSISREIAVCPSCECTTIKSALAEARNGDKILLHSGTYREGNILIEKAIELAGNDNVIIDGAKSGDIITVHSNGVTLRNLHLKNSGESFSKDLAAVKVERAQHCTIEGCTLSGNYFGIYLSYAQNCVIRNNTVAGIAAAEFNSGNAIHLWNCRKITVERNRVSKHRDGIYLELSDNCAISENLAQHNIRYGLHFMFSDNSVYSKNIFTKNQAGVAVMYSKNIVMRENEFSHNWGAASYGLLLKEIRHGQIAGNTFTQNTVAIFAEDIEAMDIYRNTFSNNGWAMKVAGISEGNLISENNFIANTFELGTNALLKNICFEQNYWSSYTGFDLNRDGIGDVAHQPMSRFTYLAEQQQESLLMMRSLLINLLNLAEKTNPAFSNATVQDAQPLMQALH